MSQPHLDDDALAALTPLIRQLVDLKRVRTAGTAPMSLAERLFQRAWTALADGAALNDVAHHVAARALVATRLGGVDAGVLRTHGLSDAERTDVLAEALRDAAAPVDDALAERLLRAAVEDEAPSWSETDDAHDPVPLFVSRLRDQPRAGVTYPGKPRLMLAPTESHADHCALVALAGMLLAPAAGADPAQLFLVGLAHHLHNAMLPDAGHAGDVLLGEHRTALEDAARERALDELPDALRAPVEDALAVPATYDPPAAHAFHAADALDRVLEIEWHARTARFTMDVALDDYHLVHEGPEQALQLQALRAAGIGEEGER